MITYISSVGFFTLIISQYLYIIYIIFFEFVYRSTCYVLKLSEAQKESKSESELDEMWWKMAGELVAKYYAAREEVEKDVEGRE